MNIEKIEDDITKEILTDDWSMEMLISNCIRYAIANNNCKTNYVAQELFENVLSSDSIKKYFSQYKMG